MRRRPAASLPAKLALAVAGLAIGLASMEVLIRLTGLDTPRVWVPDFELGWTHLPQARRHFTEEGDGLIEINRLGYRDRERQPAKASGGFRIVVLGDSMTEGVQVDLGETYCHVLEDRLARVRPGVEVWNLGVNGYSPIQEYLLFRREVDRLRPDLVILALFLDNDVAGCHPALSTTQGQSPFLAASDHGELAFDFSRSRQSYEDYHREPVAMLRRYSATYRLVGTLRGQIAGRIRSAGVGDGPEASRPIPTRYHVYLPPGKRDPAWERAWRDLEAVLRELNAESLRRGIDFVVLGVPAGQVVREDAWEGVLRENPQMAGRSWDLDGPAKRLDNFAREQGIPLIRDDSAFRRAGPDPPLFFGNVGHLTPAGHEILAGVVESYLLEHGFLDGLARGPSGPEPGPAEADRPSLGPAGFPFESSVGARP